MAKNQNHRWLIIKPSGSLLIQFGYQKQRYQLAPVPGGRSDNLQDMAIANKVASEIELSVKLGNFTGLDPWKPKRLVKPEIVQSLTLNEIWQQYKIAKADKVSRASQLSVWRQVDRCLIRFEGGIKSLEELTPSHLISLFQTKYCTAVISRTLDDLHAACNFAVKHKLISNNPLLGYKDYLITKITSKRSKKCYSHDEALMIINAFKNSPSKFVNHYASFVEFLFLTGVRPQLAIALTWEDIKRDKIIFNKGFTKGVVTEGKTGRTTVYPLYP